MRNLCQIGVVGQVETKRKSAHMGVRGYSLPQIKKLAQNNMRRLVSHSRKSLQFFCSSWNPPFEIDAHFFRRGDYVSCLIAKNGIEEISISSVCCVARAKS